MSIRFALTIAAFIVFLIGGIAWSASYYHTKYQAEKDRADKAESVTNNVITAVNLFNDIAKATNDAQQQNTAASQTRIVYIKETLKADPCASQLVPSSVTDSLRKHADSLRTGSGSASG